MSVCLYSLLSYLVCKGMHHIIICGQSGSNKFSHDFWKKKLLNTKPVLIFSITFGTYLTIRQIQQDNIMKCTH